MKKKLLLLLLPLLGMSLSSCELQLVKEPSSGKIDDDDYDDDDDDDDDDDEKPEHAGTAADPYTGADAVIVGMSLEKGKVTKDSYYIKGTVIGFEETFSTQYGNYSFAIDGGFVCWRLKNGPTGALFNEGDIEIGDEVTVYAKIQNYNGTAETSGGYVVDVEKPGTAEVVAITSVASSPTTVIKNESILPATVTLNVEYSDGSTDVKQATKVECDTSTVADSVEAKAWYNSVGPVTFNVKVIDTLNYGTENAPLTATEAMSVMTVDCATSGSVSKQALYVQAEVADIVNTFDYDNNDSIDCLELYITDGTTNIYVYRVHCDNAIGGSIGVGSTIKFKGFATNYNGVLEFKDNGGGDGQCVILEVSGSTKTISGIESVSAPSTIAQNGTLDVSKVNVVITYAEGGNSTVHPDSIDLVTSELGSVTGTVHVGTFTKTFTIEVIASMSFVKATSIAVGDKVTLVCEDAKQELSELTDIGKVVAYEGSIAHPVELEVVAGSEDGSFAFKYGSNYVKATDGNKLYGNGTEVASDTSWTVSFDTDGNATIANVEYPERVVWYNVSNPRFACYTGKSANNSYYAVQLYKGSSGPVDPAVNSVTVSPSTKELVVDEEADLVATVSVVGDASQEVTWTSSDDTKVSVDSNGKIKGLAVTTEPVIITATSKFDDKKSGTCSVTVTENKPPVEEIEVGDSVAIIATSLGLGAEYGASAEGADYAYAGAKLNGTSMLFGTQDGILYNSKQFSKAIVGVEVEFKDIACSNSAVGTFTFGTAVNPTENTVKIGKDTNYKMNVAGNTVAFKLDATDCKFFQYKPSGANSTISKIALIFDASYVVPQGVVKGVTLSDTAVELTDGGQKQLSATVSIDYNASTEVTWSVEGDAVSVENGLVTAEKQGTAVVTATAVDDSTKSASCTFTVKAAAVSKYALVKSAQDLVLGSKIVIAAAGSAKAMGVAQNSGKTNHSQTDIVKMDDKLAEFDSEQVLVTTLEAGAVENTYSFKLDDGTYLGNDSTGKNNYLKNLSSKSAYSSFTISIADSGEATIVVADSEVARNTIMYNSSSSCFSCYASGQAAVVIYQEPYQEQTEGLKSIEVTTGPSKTEYKLNEVFSAEGLVVTANYYGQQASAPVTAYTLSEPDMSTEGTKEITVTYEEKGVVATAKFNIIVTSEQPQPHTNTVKAAYEAGVATTGTTDEMTMRGEVTSKFVNGSNKVCFIQDGDYAVYVFKLSDTDYAKFEVGDEITVKAKMTKYYGTIEATNITSVVKETTDEIETPVAKTLASKEELDACGQGLLVKAEVTVKDSLDGWTSSASKNPKVLLNGKEITLNLNKAVYNETVANKLAALKAGDDFEITNCYVGIYNGTLQMCATERFDVNKVVHEVKSIALSGDMTNKEYGPGMDWDYSGIVCTATLENGATKQLSFDDLTITSLSAAKPAKGVESLTIDVKVTDFPSVTGSIVITGITFDEGVQQLHSATSSIFGENLSVENKVGTYTNEGISFTLEQGEGTDSIRTSDPDHLRMYAKHNFYISFTTDIVKVEITCQSNTYATTLAGCTAVGGTATAEGSVVTLVVPEESPTKTVGFTSLTKQVRITSVTVYYY